MKYVWAPDKTNRAEYLVRQELTRLSHILYQRAQGASDDAAKQLYKAARNLQTRGALTKALPELQAHPALTLTTSDFDADDWLLNTPSGLWDLKAGKMLPPDPGKLCSKHTAVAPREQPTPVWDDFLGDVTDGDEALAEYLQKLVGYALTGSTQEQILVFVHGPPLTGKTVFLETISGVFGTYHETTSANTFAATSGDRHPTDVAALAGARLVTASETQEGRGWDTQRVKMLTGGDEVAARFMRQDFFTYRPRYQIIMVGNHEPEIKGVDEALLRRLHLVPFENKPMNPDRLLYEKLKNEWPGILAWALEGTRKWLDTGLTPPQIVVDRTETYRAEEDPVGQFLDECCVLTDGGTVSRRALYRAWSQWCRAQGEEPGTLKQLKRRFQPKQAEYGWEDARVSEGGHMRRGYEGISLREGFE